MNHYTNFARFIFEFGMNPHLQSIYISIILMSNYNVHSLKIIPNSKINPNNYILMNNFNLHIYYFNLHSLKINPQMNNYISIINHHINNYIWINHFNLHIYYSNLQSLKIIPHNVFFKNRKVTVQALMKFFVYIIYSGKLCKEPPPKKLGLVGV